MAITLCGNSFAQDVLWTGAVSNRWNEGFGLNWQPNVVPSAIDLAYFQNSANQNIDLSGNPFVGGVILTSTTPYSFNTGELTVWAGFIATASFPPIAHSFNERVHIPNGGLFQAAADNTLSFFGGLDGTSLATEGPGQISLYDTSNLSGDIDIDGGTLRHFGFTNSVNTNIGAAAGTTATAIVSASATWNNSGNTVVGKNGDGTLEIYSEAAVTNVIGIIGDRSGSSGSATVTGNSASWSNSGDLIVANRGSGDLTITGGATVTSTRATIGVFNTGTVTIRDATSSWDAGDLFIGSSGALPGIGTVNVENGGKLLTGLAQLGNAAFSTGTIAVSGTGSRWTSANGRAIDLLLPNHSQLITVDQIIGDLANGHLTLMHGARVEGTNAIVGHQEFAVGSATLSGGSTWFLNGSGSDGLLFAGWFGSATIGIDTGATLDVNRLVLGTYASATGTATIHGTDSKLLAGGIDVAWYGTGILNVEAGAEVAVEELHLVHSDPPFFSADGSATVVVTGEDSQIVAGKLFATAGNSTLTIEHGARVVAHEFEIDSSTQLRLDDGTLSVSDFDVRTSTPIDWVSGTVEKLKPVDQKIILENNQEADSGIRLLERLGHPTLKTGQRYLVEGVLGMDREDVLGLDGGTIQAGRTLLVGTAQVNVSADSLFIGEVEHNAHIDIASEANLVFTNDVFGAGGFSGGGTVTFMEGYAPGNSAALVTSAGTIAFDSGATLSLELGGAARGSEYDALDASNIALDGRLQVTLIDAYVPVFGSSFDLLMAASIVGAFDEILWPTLPDGLFFDHMLILLPSGKSVFRATVVPLPAAAWLFASAVLVLVSKCRKLASVKPMRTNKSVSSIPMAPNTPRICRFIAQ